jgi:glycogen debranching enzyme
VAAAAAVAAAPQPGALPAARDSLQTVSREALKAPASAVGRFFDGGFSKGAAAGAVPAGRPARPARTGLSRSSWWRDSSKTHAAVTVPLYALRREEGDPGIGKYSDLGRYYRDVLAPQGVKVMHLLPHFAVKDESPYAPVSLNALNEGNVDWAAVPEVDAAGRERLEAGSLAERQAVDHAKVRAREGAVAAAAYARFDHASERGRVYAAFKTEEAAWLGEYGEFMALSRLIGKPALAWTDEDVAAARADASFSGLAATHMWTQWLAYGQLKEALDAVHAAGGRALFDIPMFRAKDSVDAWKRPEAFKDLATRNPGIKNQWIDEDWKDLALWNWSKARAEGWRPMLEPYRRWLDFGFDGARVDALHFAYDFGNGQLASGDEPGDDYVKALAEVFTERGTFPLAEAFEGKAEAAERFGFVTVYGDWKKLSSHDDPRSDGFMGKFAALSRQAGSGRNAKFVGYTLGDEWGDPFPLKEMSAGRSLWRWRVPLASDPDYAARARSDARAQLGAWTAALAGDVWAAGAALKGAFAKAAGTFVKRVDGVVQIWAASLDWFLEEWGRDTFISLPGLLVSTGRTEDAKDNIRQFARHERGGLIPNRIAKDSEYNTVDGSLWFIQAVERVGEPEFTAEMLPVVRRVMAAYAAGTGYQRYGRFNRIYMDADGLIVSPAQATWMDADPEGRDRPVTPRHGKTVENNALWYSNLRALARMERAAGNADAAAEADRRADQVKRSFNKTFWFETEDNRRAWGGTGGALRDVAQGDPHGEAVRPNMLFAVSHGGDLLPLERQKAVVTAATRDLLTPYGLRTLSYRDSRYHGRYDTAKPPLEKDQAYHQGTVWPWLMGSYVDALVKVRRAQGWEGARIRAEVRGLLTPLAEFLAGSAEGSLPEVFDGGAPERALQEFSLDDPAGLGPLVASLPRVQNRGGTRSQAWSVAEILRHIFALLP